MATTTTQVAEVNDEEQQETISPEGSGQEDANLLTNEEADSSDEIPAKFVGKSPLEIIRSYKELEKHTSRVSSEKAQAERAAEEERQRRFALEAAYQNQQPARVTQQQEPTDYDPTSVLEKHWNDSPKDAIKAALGTVVNTVGNAFQSQIQEAKKAATAQRWAEIQRQNPEEAKELEPIMVQLSSRMGKVVRPDQVNSPETLDALYLMARGQNVDKSIAAKVKSELQKKAAVTNEKRSAFTESNNSQGEGENRSFEKMTREEMRAALGVSEKY